MYIAALKLDKINLLIQVKWVTFSGLCGSPDQTNKIRFFILNGVCMFSECSKDYSSLFNSINVLECVVLGGFVLKEKMVK